MEKFFRALSMSLSDDGGCVAMKVSVLIEMGGHRVAFDSN